MMKVLELQHIASMETRPDPLVCCERPVPEPAAGEVLIRIHCCGVCHTELDEIEGRTPPRRLPVVPGHQVVGMIEKVGRDVQTLSPGTRVGVAWIYSACGHCSFCCQGLENLCQEFRATGRDADGGYAECMVAPADFVYPLPDSLGDLEAAPLLCAGAIGYRSLRLTGLQNGQSLGLTGFGGSGHLVLQMTTHLFPDSRVYVFARSPRERQFALDLGACWAGDLGEPPPESLQAVIDTTPVWKSVLTSLDALAPAGRLVINAIRKEENDRSVLLDLDYPHHLWLEKEIKSVANVCRADVSSFLELAAGMGIRPAVTPYPLEQANRALQDLRRGHLRGAKVLVMPVVDGICDA